MESSARTHIVPFAQGDLDAIMAIEPEIFSLPWSRKSYEELLCLKTVEMFVAKRAKELVGYMLFQWWGDELELHTIGVAPTLQRQGIGRMLMEALMKEVRGRRVEKIFLLVRVSNTPAIRLYEAFGFKTIGLRERYYSDNLEDALVMRGVISS